MKKNERLTFLLSFITTLTARLVSATPLRKTRTFNGLSKQNKEAEMIKLFRNNFLTVKVSFCNEIYEYCKMKDIDYNTIINIASSDTRIGTSHTTVPGHDGSFGFGGTCFPKDISNTLYDMKKIGMNSYILEATVNRNNNVDRPNKNWKDKGRSVV